MEIFELVCLGINDENLDFKRVGKILQFKTSQMRLENDLRCRNRSRGKKSNQRICNMVTTEYAFPQRVRVYLKNSERVRAGDGDFVCGTCFKPYNRSDEPHIRIAVGDYPKILSIRGKDNALAEYLWCIAHELTHYFQWLNDVELTLAGEERQANRCASEILEIYANTRDHP